jgi:hydroxymethylpyrimidine/phosphomethylpyrimidine kinase
MLSNTLEQPAVLTIAGSDSSGGAGIQVSSPVEARLRKCLKKLDLIPQIFAGRPQDVHGTFMLWDECHRRADCAKHSRRARRAPVTAPVYRTAGVEFHVSYFVHIFTSNTDLVGAFQLRVVLEDTDIRAMKTGMLYDAASIHAVVRGLRSHYEQQPMPPLLCDPVCVSTSGHTLLQPDAVEVMVSELFPLTYLITPNKPEAELILSTRGLPSSINNLDDVLRAADDLMKLGPQVVLLKGGHLTVHLADVERISEDYPSLRVVRDILSEENMEILQVAERDPGLSEIVVDVLHTSGATTLFVRPKIDSTSTHGTGCTLSAAIVCGLSRGLSGKVAYILRWPNAADLLWIQSKRQLVMLRYTRTSGSRMRLPLDEDMVL